MRSCARASRSSRFTPTSASSARRVSTEATNRPAGRISSTWVGVSSSIIETQRTAPPPEDLRQDAAVELTRGTWAGSPYAAAEVTTAGGDPDAPPVVVLPGLSPVAGVDSDQLVTGALGPVRDLLGR